jgi:hypothetical protein
LEAVETVNGKTGYVYSNIYIQLLAQIMIVLIALILTFSQPSNAQDMKFIHGKVIDSSSDQPIAFTWITSEEGTITTSNIAGKFKASVRSDTNSIIEIYAKHYKRKEVAISPEKADYLIELDLDTFELDFKIEVEGLPTDTFFYKSGRIKSIYFGALDHKTFYENGELKSIETNQGIRQFSEEGRLIYQSVSHSSHFHSITTWYPNGQVKSHGTETRKRNVKLNRGEWVRNDDWMYWSRQGKKKGK